MTTGLLNPTHLILILLVALLILGPKRLPQAGRSIGQGMREFRYGITGHDETDPLPQTETHTATPADPAEDHPPGANNATR